MVVVGEGGGGAGQVRAPTIQASVKFRDFVEQYRRSLLTCHYQIW